MFVKHIGKRISHNIFSRLVKSNYYNVVNNGLPIPSSLRQLLFHNNGTATEFPAYYTEEEFPGHSHLLKDYSSGVGSLRPKRLGYCYDFDGANDYVTTGTGNSINSKPVACSGWVNFNSPTAFTYPFGAWFNGSGRYLGFMVGASPNQLWLVYDNATPNAFTVSGLFTGWHHLAITFDNSVNELIAYLDGIEVRRIADVETTVASYDAAIGGRANGTNVVDMKAFDVRFYDTHLSADNVTYLYTNGLSGTDPGTANLVAHYPLQEESGPVAYDKVNGNHGTITNAVTSGVGSIHQPDAGVTKSYPNDAGYSRRMVFDGVDDYVEVTGMTSHTHYFGACTISAKVYITNLTSNQNIWALGLKAYRLLLTNLGEWSHGNNTATGVYATLGEHELSVDYDALGRAISFSVDGVEVWTGVGAGSNSGTSFFIGSGDGSSLFFKGLIWDFAITGSAVKNFAFEGYGNTDADWVDTTGGDNNGTVNGSPDNVYIPAATTTLDALGGTLTETGEVPRYGTALGYGWQGNGSTAYFSLGPDRIPVGDHKLTLWYYNTSGVAGTHRVIDARVGVNLYTITANRITGNKAEFFGKNSVLVEAANAFVSNSWHYVEIEQIGFCYHL
jgi:hypothetical protein